MGTENNVERPKNIDDRALKNEVDSFRQSVHGEVLLQLTDVLRAEVARLQERFGQETLRHFHAYHALFGSGLDDNLQIIEKVDADLSQKILGAIAEIIERLKASNDFAERS